jgi:hypothetical protein
VELYPRIDGREPDLRTRVGQDDWTYVEVAQPNKSQAEKAAHQILVRLTQSLQEVATAFSVDVYLRREPRDDELIIVIEKIRALSRQQGTKQEELPDTLGVLLLNFSAPGQVGRLQLPEEGPRIGLVAIAGDGSKPNRKISVSIPFSDARAADFLTTEAGQLPTTYPGLVALEVSRASGGIKVWVPLLERCFQPDLYSRVSAVCLFDDAVLTFHKSELPVFDTRLVHNPHAKFPLPDWIGLAVLESRKGFDEAMSSRLSMHGK